MCLHFPRIVGYRQDKDWQECLTQEEFQQLYQGTGRNLKKINKRELSMEDFTINENLECSLMKIMFNPKEVERISNILTGYEICVLSASLREGITPEEVKAMVVKLLKTRSIRIQNA